LYKDYLRYLHWKEIKLKIRTKLVDSLLDGGDTA
jgi:hypothetical protein